MAKECGVKAEWRCRTSSARGWGVGPCFMGLWFSGLMGVALLWPAMAHAQATEPNTPQEAPPAALDDVLNAPPPCSARLDLKEPNCFENRVQRLLVERLQIVTAEQRRLVTTAFALYQIADRELFLKSLAKQDAARRRLSVIMQTHLRRVMGGATARDVFSTRRAELLGEVREAVTGDAAQYGVAVIDVRLREVDLPAASLQAVLSRMKAERQQEAAAVRAQGRAVATKRRAVADRERAQIESEARLAAARRAAKAVAERARITAAAFAEDPDFFDAYYGTKAPRPEPSGAAAPTE